MAYTLQEIRHELPAIISDIEGIIFTAGSSVVTVSGIINFRRAIEKLRKIAEFDDALLIILKSGLYSTLKDTIQITTSSELANIRKEIKYLKDYLKIFLNILEQNLPEQKSDSINIKLPPIENFNDLSKVSKEIHKAISQIIINDIIEGEEKIISVENGSIWFNVKVGSFAISVVGAAIWSAAVINKKSLEGKILEEQLRSLQIHNESLQDILKAQKAVTDNMIEAEAVYLAEEFYKTKDPETILRLQNSIKTFADLMNKGAEIKPALMAPEEVTNLFPTIPELVESKAVKKIDKE